MGQAAGFAAGHSLSDSLLVIIDDFDQVGPVAAPDKTDAVLIVDTDTVLPLTVTTECFKTVPWGNPQIIQGADRVK